MATTRTKQSGALKVPRVVSFIVLLVIILLLGAVFFQVMAQFLVPLFLASVLLVVFQPLHRRLLGQMPKWPRVAALLTTIAIMLVVLLPTIWLGFGAYVEAEQAYAWLQSDEGEKYLANLHDKAEGWYVELTRRFISDGDVTGDGPPPSLEPAQSSPDTQAATKPKEPTQSPNFEPLLTGLTNSIGAFLLTGVQKLLGLLIGLVIMVVALYFFLADGPAMIHGLMHLLPLDERYELELLARFASISRSVVLATMLSAVMQGLLAGVGYYFALPSTAPVFLLTAATMLFAIVPFIGAFGVWGPVCLVLLAAGGGDGESAGSNWVSVTVLAVYCVVVVSGVDNIIKPYILHGQSNLHPLLALLSILGGVKVLGPVGILVGPMLVSFLQALLTMFQRELERWGDPTQRSMDKLSPEAKALSEHIEAAVEATDDDAHSVAKSDKPTANKKKKGR